MLKDGSSKTNLKVVVPRVLLLTCGTEETGIVGYGVVAARVELCVWVCYWCLFGLDGYQLSRATISRLDQRANTIRCSSCH